MLVGQQSVTFKKLFCTFGICYRLVMSDFNENVNIFSWVETFWKRSYSVIREENNLGSKYYVNLMLLFSVNGLNIDLIS